MGVNGGVVATSIPTGPTGGGITMGGGGTGAGAQPASTSATAADASRLRRVDNRESVIMWILFLEAAAALGVLVFIVWWTMFSGRK